VTQCPSTDETPDFPDVLCVVNRKDSLNRAGFRVETFPDPNEDVDKSASKQYKYVPLRQIRPLNQWQNVLRGIPANKLDSSIQHALTCMVSVSLLEKYRFTGKWPHASIFCKGIYIGAELLIEGDAVKILPDEHALLAHAPQCTAVLVISTIRLQLHDIDEEHTKDMSPRIFGRSLITLVGTTYTLDPLRAYTPPSATSTSIAAPQPVSAEIIKSALPTVGAAAYGDWYALHSPTEKIEITHDRVLGRLYESGAMGMWTGTLGNHKTSKTPPSLSYDLSSVLAGRRYGTLTDERIPESQSGTIRWFWADNRVQALSLETINGVEVGAYDTVHDLRTMQAWRARLKIVDGTFTSTDMNDSILARQKGRSKGSRVIGGMVVGPEEDSGSEEADPPPKGSFSEAVRSRKGVGGMVGAGAALEEDENEADKEGGEEVETDYTEEDEPPAYSSKVSIMEQKPEWNSNGFIIPDDPDIEMLPIKRSTSNIARTSPEIRGPAKARKSTGGSKIPSIHAGRYDNSITPAMTRETAGSRWKGKGRADTTAADWDPDTPFRSVEPDNAIPIYDDNDNDNNDERAGDEEEEEEEEVFYVPGNFVEPEPKDDDDYDEQDEEGEDDEDEDELDDDEEERIRTLANFRKDTFDRTGKKITF